MRAQGILPNGTQFDTSVGRAPFSFPVGGHSVIPGIDYGVIGMWCAPCSPTALPHLFSTILRARRKGMSGSCDACMLQVPWLLKVSSMMSGVCWLAVKQLYTHPAGAFVGM